MQQRLNWIERRRNVRGAFAANPVILLGNRWSWLTMCFTTGATLNELALWCHAAGAVAGGRAGAGARAVLRRRERVVKFNRAVA